jgi:hypothetical protein
MLDNICTYLQEHFKDFNSLTEKEKRLKRKRNRYYHALSSGMTWHKNDYQYFLTLTSSPTSPGLMESFNHFVTVVRMASPDYLVKCRYISRKEALKWYPAETWTRCFKFEFCCLQTSEGCGVLHIVFAGDRLPIGFIRHLWDNIHGARQIVIKHIEKGEDSRLKKYLMKQYLYSQEGFIRYSCSSNWVYPGFRRDWEKMYKTMTYWPARVRWLDLMDLHQMPGQKDLQGGSLYTPSEKKFHRKMRKEVKRGRKACLSGVSPGV